MADARTGQFQGSTGRIATRIWPNPDAAHVVLLAHGYGEHIGRYEHVAEALVARGIGLKVGAIGSDPEDFIHTGHVNDLLWRYRMSSQDVVEMACGLLGRAAYVPQGRG